MRRAALALVILGAVGLTLGWNATVRAPRAAERADLQQQVENARAEGEALGAVLTRLRTLAGGAGAREAELARLDRLVPADPDMAGFIRIMDELAARSQVQWFSLVPAPPAVDPAGGPVTIGLSINAGGTFFQVLDYLRGLEKLDRLVVVDAVDIATAGAASGTPTLSVNLRARTFAASTGGVPGRAATAPGPAGSALGLAEAEGEQ